MIESLQYNTSFFSGVYKLHKQGGFIGTFNKTAWLSPVIDNKIENYHYRFERLSIFFPKILLTVYTEYTKIGDVTVSLPLLVLGRRHLARFGSGRSFEWKVSGFLNHNWEWKEEGNLIVSAKENNTLFHKHGTIFVSADNTENKMVSILGLYLRHAIPRQNAIVISTIIFFLLMLFLRLYL